MFYKNLKLLHRFVCLQCNQSTSFAHKDFISKNYYCRCSQLSIYHYHPTFSWENKNIAACAIFNINNFKISLVLYFNPVGNIDTYKTTIFSTIDSNYLCEFDEFPNFLGNSNINNYLNSISTFQ